MTTYINKTHTQVIIEFKDGTNVFLRRGQTYSTSKPVLRTHGDVTVKDEPPKTKRRTKKSEDADES